MSYATRVVIRQRNEYGTVVDEIVLGREHGPISADMVNFHISDKIVMGIGDTLTVRAEQE